MTSLHICLCTLLLASGIYCDSSQSTLITGAKVIYRAIRDCQDDYVYTCLKVRALKSINKLLNKNEVTIFDGVSFTKMPKTEGARDFDETVNEIDSESFPKDPVEREETVDTLLQDRLTRFFTSHVLKIGLPNIGVPQDFEEGRRRGGGGGGGGKGNNGGMLAAAMMGISIKTLFIKALALIAAKALLVAKIALVLVTILGLHKLFHQDHHGYHGHHGHYHHKYHGKKVHEQHIPLHHGGELNEGHFGGGGLGGGHFEFEDAGHLGGGLGGGGLGSGGFGGGHFGGLSTASIGHGGGGGSDLSGAFGHAGGNHDRTVRFRRDLPDFRSHLLAYRRQIAHK